MCGLLLLQLILAPLWSIADPLKELMRSPEMQKFDQGWTAEDINGPRWFKLGTEFASIFVDRDGLFELNVWIAPASGIFVGGAQSGNRFNEHVETERVYSAANMNDIRVRILVPHPKYASMIQFGLVAAFAQLEPPTLRFENKEDIVVRNRKAVLYTLNNGSCMLLFRLNKGAVVQLSQNECRSLKDLVSLGELLDLARLERKLDS
jgi:hypothetical protein